MEAQLKAFTTAIGSNGAGPSHPQAQPPAQPQPPTQQQDIHTELQLEQQQPQPQQQEERAEHVAEHVTAQSNRPEQPPQTRSDGPAPGDVEDAQRVASNLTDAVTGKDTPTKGIKRKTTSSLPVEPSPRKASPQAPLAERGPEKQGSPEPKTPQAQPTEEHQHEKQHTEQVPAVGQLPITQPIPFGGTPPGAQPRSAIEQRMLAAAVGGRDALNTVPASAPVARTRTAAGEIPLTSLASAPGSGGPKAKGWLFSSFSIFKRPTQPTPSPPARQDLNASDKQLADEPSAPRSAPAPTVAVAALSPALDTRSAEHPSQVDVIPPTQAAPIVEESEPEGEARRAPQAEERETEPELMEVDAKEEDMLPPTQVQMPLPTQHEASAGPSVGDPSMGPAEATAAPLRGAEADTESGGDLVGAPAGSQEVQGWAIGPAQTEAAAETRMGETPVRMLPHASSGVPGADEREADAWGSGGGGGQFLTQDPAFMATQATQMEVSLAQASAAPGPLASGAGPADATMNLPAAHGGGGEEEAREDTVTLELHREDDGPDTAASPERFVTRARTRPTRPAPKGMEYQQRKRQKPTGIVSRLGAQQAQQAAENDRPQGANLGAAEAAEAGPGAPGAQVLASPQNGPSPRPGASASGSVAQIALPKSTLAARRKLQELRRQRQAAAAASANHGAAPVAAEAAPQVPILTEMPSGSVHMRHGRAMPGPMPSPMVLPAAQPGPSRSAAASGAPMVAPAHGSVHPLVHMAPIPNYGAVLPPAPQPPPTNALGKLLDILMPRAATPSYQQPRP